METNSEDRLVSQAQEMSANRTAAAPTLGTLLKQRREAQGADLAAVAAAIRVPLHYLRAIEDERYDLLPGKAYAIGFIRCFAKYLGLPQQEMIDRYKAEANPCGPVHNLYWHEPVRESRLPQRSLVVAGLIAALCVYSVWFSLSGSDVAVTPVPDMVLARSVEKAPPKAEQIAVVDRAGHAEAVAVAAVPEAAPPVQANDGTTMAQPEAVAQLPTPKPRPEVESQTVDTAALAQTFADLTPKVIEGRRPLALMAAEAIDGPQMVTVHVVEEAWLHVTQGEKILFSGVLPAGRDYRPPSGEGVLLTTGNAGGVILKLDDWASGPLGRSGLVRRNIPLEAAIWRSRQARAESF